jgi:uncharacterized protein YqgC (DUF456 family)
MALESITLIILGLIIGGVIGSLVPMMPGALLSLAGIAVYFFYTDDPSILFTVFGIFTGVFTLLVDWFSGAVASKYGGASTKTSIAAGIAGLIGLVVSFGNPLGLALAVAATVFIREYLIHGDEEDSFRAALYTTIGVLGSGIIQAILTGSILVAYLLTFVI